MPTPVSALPDAEWLMELAIALEDKARWYNSAARVRRIAASLVGSDVGGSRDDQPATETD